VDTFALLAEVGGGDPACAAEARALFAGPLPPHPFDAALRAKRILAGRGFRDDATAFCLPEMLARRGGNCLGLTLLVGAALIDRGHDVGFVVRLAPLDDVHDAGVDYFARLLDGVDGDSRLPEASDRSASGRFIPVEHASIVLAGDQSFEATNLADLEVPPGWAPVAEASRRIGFVELAATVWAERAKLAQDPRAMVAFARRALRADPGNREPWVEVWRAALALGRRALADAAAARYLAAAGDDSLYYFTRYRMRGDERDLDRALARLPSYAEAYAEKHALVPLARGGADDHDIRRHLAIAAWLAAGSEILDLARFYRDRADAYARVFSADELAALLATFAPAASVAADSPS
jgi:hypothetical protein